MKKIFLCLGFLFVGLRLVAVTPSPYTEAVGFSCIFTVNSGASGGGGLTVYDDNGSPNVNWTASVGATESTIGLAWLRPGKQYTCRIQGGLAGPWNSASGQYEINGNYRLSYTAPAGYSLYVNGIEKDMEYRTVSMGSGSPSMSINDTITLELRPVANGARAEAGSFSGIDLGKSVTWEVGLGGLRTGRSAGRIIFKEKDLSSTTFPPASRERLYYTAPSSNGQIKVVKDGASNQILRQVGTPQAVVDLVDVAGNGYWLRFYSPDQTTWTGSIYTINAGQNPWRTIRVESPAANQLKITETECNASGSATGIFVSTVSAPSIGSGAYTWTLTEGGNAAGSASPITTLRTTTLTSSLPSGGGRDTLVVVADGAGVEAARTKFHYETQPAPWNGEEVTVLRAYPTAATPDASALTTTYTYWTTSTAAGNYRKVKTIIDPTGNWTSYLYYDDFARRGQLSVESHPFASSPASPVVPASLSSGDSISHDYVADYSGRLRIESSRIAKTTNIQTGKQTTTPTLNSTTRITNYVAKSFASSGASDYLATTSDVMDSNFFDSDLADHTLSVKRPDLTQDVMAYYFCTVSGGVYTSTSTPNFSTPIYFRTNIWHGSTSSGGGAVAFNTYDTKTITSIYLIPNKSTMEVVIQNPAGLLVRKETHVFTGGTSFALLGTQDFTYDVAGRLTQTTASNGSITTNTYTGIGGRLFSSVDTTGSETDFTYDDIGRVKTSIKKGANVAGSPYAVQNDVTTTYTYDGASHATQTAVSDGSPATLSLTGTAAFDLAGRITQQVANVGSGNSLTTVYTYASGGRIVTASLPGGATKIVENNLNGSLKNITGTAVVAEYMTYSIDGTTGNRKSQHRSGTSTSLMVSTTTNDWLGRNVTIVQPAWSSGTMTQTCFYNTLGQLYKVTQPGVAATLYTYDTLGGIVQQGLDVNADNQLTASSTDRITERGWTFFLSGSNWWRRETSSAYPTATAKQLGKVETQISGFAANQLSNSSSTDIYGNVTTSSTVVDRTNKLVTTTTDTPDSATNAVQIAYNGRLMAATDTVGVTMKYGYDSLGRPNLSKDPRTGDTTTVYIDKTSLVFSVKAPSAANPQARYAYDSAGRVATVTDVFGKVANYKYNLRGQKTHEWGDTVYPVESVFDPIYGRQTNLKTFASSSVTFADPATMPWPTTNVAFTLWEYDEATGLLKAKYDAANVDSSGAAITNAKKVAYTYTAAGQPWTRTNQRGNVTTYSYSATTGELTGQVYSSDPNSTPAVGYTYNRLGALDTVSDATGQRTFTYNLTGTLELQREDLPATYFASRRLTPTYATSGVIGRTTGLQLGTSSVPTADQAVSYGYQTDGRLGTITADGNLFTYGYLPDSHLVQSVYDSTGFKQNWRAYDANRDTLNYFSNGENWSQTPMAIFTLIRDDAGRIISNMKTGTMFNRYTGAAIRVATGYNDRSEVTSDVTYVGWSVNIVAGRNDSYVFDNLGNRSSVTHRTITNNSQQNTAAAQYTLKTNGLNQYDMRDIPAFFDVAGAAPGATVTVSKSDGSGAETAARNGAYFFDAYPLSNSSSAVFTGLKATDGSLTPVQPQAFVPKNRETFTYDLDGNMTQDGRWDYTYDAENRLISMQTRTALTPSPFSTVNARQLTFKYDYLGRRVQKTVRDGFGTILTDEKFVWNGGLMIAKLDATNNNALRSSYFWGLDLSGTQQGAGGVGGLLMTKEDGIPYLTVSDHMGNIHGMVTGAPVTVGGTNYSAGSVVAEYEYDSFGNTLCESGPCAGLHPFRSASKYTDLETGLVYYGQRYYSPSLGRFINQDPIAESGGVNLYGFCGNNGVNSYDYLGMDPMKEPEYVNTARILTAPKNLYGWTGYGSSLSAAQQAAATDYSYALRGMAEQRARVWWAEGEVAAARHWAGQIDSSGHPNFSLDTGAGVTHLEPFEVRASPDRQSFADLAITIDNMLYAGANLDSGYRASNNFVTATAGAAADFFVGAYYDPLKDAVTGSIPVQGFNAIASLIGAGRSPGGLISGLQAQQAARQAALRSLGHVLISPSQWTPRGIGHATATLVGLLSLRLPAVGSTATNPNILSGHGEFLGGELTVPKGTSVTVWTEHGNTITDALGNAIETGGEINIGKFPEIAGARTYLPGSTMPDYTLTPPFNPNLTIMGNPTTVSTATPLSQLLQPGMGNVNWAACLFVE